MNEIEEVVGLSFRTKLIFFSNLNIFLCYAYLLRVRLIALHMLNVSFCFCGVASRLNSVSQSLKALVLRVSQLAVVAGGTRG